MIFGRTVRLGLITAVFGLVSACSSNVSDTIEKGKSYLSKGEVVSAVIEFKNAVQQDASSVPARIALADALELTGELAGAEQHYRQALKLGGDANELAPRIALLLLDRSDNAILIKDFANMELSQPLANSNLRGLVALAELAMKHRDKAEAQLAKANSNVPAVRLARAQLAIQGGRSDDAMKEIGDALNEQAAPWWLYRAASRIYFAKGDRENALSSIKRAYELAGWHHGVIGEYAEQLYYSGKVAEAKPLRGKLWKLSPKYYRTFFVEALSLMDEGKHNEAHEFASKVLVTLPEHIPSLMIAARVELDRGELSSADTHLRKIQFLTPYSVELMRMQLVLELKRNNLKEARAILERALRQAPNDRRLLAASAELAWSRGDKAGAVKQLSSVLQTEAPPVELLSRLAEMEFAMGKRDQARQTIEKAVQLVGDNVAQRDNVFRSLLRMRFIDKASEMAKAELQRRPKDPEPYLWMAAVVGSEGNETAALEQTNRALDIRADYYPALLALAKTATTDERARQYDERLKKAVDVGTKDARIYFDLARRMRVAGADAEKIGALLERSIVADPASVGLREATIRHWLTWGKKDKAISLASGGEAANPDNLAMKAMAASTHEAVGNFEQAITKYSELKARFPDRVDWSMKHAQLLVRAGKTPEAIQMLRKLISQRPDEPTPYQALAMLQAGQKQGNDALVTAGMLADRPKLKTAGLLLQGDVLAQLEQDTKALKAYEEAGKAGEVETAALRKIELQARTYGGDYALKELRDWLIKHQDSIPAMTLAVRYAVAKGDYVTAAKYLETLDKLNPNNPVTLNDLAWAYTQVRKPAALAIAQKANALAPENPQILDTLAEAQVLAGQKKEAVANLRLALSLAPQSPALKVHLAELLMEEGSKKDAANLLEGLDQRAMNKEAAARYQRVKSRL